MMETAAGAAPATVGANDRVRQLEARAAHLREHSLRATSEAGSGHPTSCLSAADLVEALRSGHLAGAGSMSQIPSRCPPTTRSGACQTC